MAILNLTPHQINLYSINDCQEVVQGKYKTLVLKEGATPQLVLPSVGVARATCTKERVGTIDYIPVFETVYGEVEGLFEPAEGTYYVVSALTAQAAVGRKDLLIVDGTVRNADGQIVGCTAFGRV